MSDWKGWFGPLKDEIMEGPPFLVEHSDFAKLLEGFELFAKTFEAIRDHEQFHELFIRMAAEERRPHSGALESITEMRDEAEDLCKRSFAFIDSFRKHR